MGGEALTSVERCEKALFHFKDGAIERERIVKLPVWAKPVRIVEHTKISRIIIRGGSSVNQNLG
jgi:hypothetical protein